MYMLYSSLFMIIHHATPIYICINISPLTQNGGGLQSYKCNY